ncbi:hypothetical protein F4820DRAFT_443743 [Hypoxylon rubiginosum]|uniref:Uncharacterized protein n=1 Tax=Hypoxylon rubiginosum TaxID=110542 RepID=A0ACB9ZE93_9PEZI|nr:hypothetical protein F4820DRAFT_443743 [Hypoxylon rubiginosum]
MPLTQEAVGYYNHLHPRYLIPSMVMCRHAGANTGGRLYSDVEIWSTMRTALQDLRQPRWSARRSLGRRWPRAIPIYTVPVARRGRARGLLWQYPLRATGPRASHRDRVVFSQSGLYVGLLHHVTGDIFCWGEARDPSSLTYDDRGNIVWNASDYGTYYYREW